MPRAPAYGVITLIRSGVETDYDLHLSPDSGDFVHIAFEEKNHLTVYQGNDEKRGRNLKSWIRNSKRIVLTGLRARDVHGTEDDTQRVEL